MVKKLGRILVFALLVFLVFSRRFSRENGDFSEV